MGFGKLINLFPGTHLISQGIPLFLIMPFGIADLTLSREREQSSFLISSPVSGNGFWHFPNVCLVSDMLLKSLLLRSSYSAKQLCVG